MYSAMLQPPEWIPKSPFKRIWKTWHRIQYKRRLRRHARATALRSMHRLQARDVQAVGAPMRPRGQPASRQPIYNPDLQRGKSPNAWWSNKIRFPEVYETVQATPRKK